jgi:hypothetical protein
LFSRIVATPNQKVCFTCGPQVTPCFPVHGTCQIFKELA